MKRACQEAGKDFCMLYMLGFDDGYNAANFVAGNKNMVYCIPSGVTSDQLVDIFIKYLNDHPESLHEKAQFLALSSLLKAFPCE